MRKEPPSYGSEGHWGEYPSDDQVTNHAAPEARDPFGEEAAKKVADLEGGARRDSYFKERDYKG